MDPEDWLIRFAAALGEPPLSGGETGAILKLARDVAHGVERRLAPLAAFLAGAAVGRAAAGGGERAASLQSALSEVTPMIPGPPEAHA